jgi:hypothetical protein
MSDHEDDAVMPLDSMGTGDPEAAHGRADDILLEVLDVLAPDVSAAWRRCRDRVGFWYS